MNNKHKNFLNLLDKLSTNGWTEDAPSERVWHYSKRHMRADCDWSTFTVRFWSARKNDMEYQSIKSFNSY